MLLTKYYLIRPEGNRESHNQVKFQGLSKHISGFLY